MTIPSATVVLLNAKDSTLLNFTQADEKGAFEFKSIKNSRYLLKVALIGYFPYQNILPVSANAINDLGNIKLKIVSKMLMEVVIKAARAPLKFRGDTVEYDASSFKVPPGSTVEDLLRRLPGIEVDADGNIKSQGKDVKRVYVEGKTFFSNDPKFATKNLGAETISKVQVFDEKSEQSKLTGIDDGVKNDKAMNLSLKDEYKKGAFGKVTAALGDQDRWAVKGNYNRFNKTEQLSFIGFGNNINQTGVNWEDYGEFKGQSSNNYDNGDFGFDVGYRSYYYESGLMRYFDGRGFTTNYGSGINYNLDNKKTKLNSSYTYNETSRTLDETSNKETFLQSSSFKNADTSHGIDFRGNHSVAMRIEQNIDSSNILIAKANINFSKSTDKNSLSSLYSDASDVPTRSLETRNDDKLNSWNLASAAIYRHRFKKKGANFAWSGGFNTNRSNGLEKPYSINRFFEANTPTEQIRSLSNDNNNTTTQFKSSLLLTEPLSKKVFWEAFYNFNATANIQDRLTQNAELQNVRVDTLTAYYTNNVLVNRLGTSFRYSNKGLNASIGIAAQQLQLKGKYAMRSDLPNLKDPINKTYSNLIPNISIRYQLFKTTYVSTNYNLGVNEPSASQLMPVTNVNNLAYQIEGNPELQPQRSHNFGLMTSYWNQSSMSSIYIGSRYQRYDNQIVYNQTIKMLKNVGMQTVSKPANVNGGDSYSLYTGTNFPLIKTKLTMDISGNVNFSNSPTFINDIKNITKNNGYRIGSSLNLTPSPKLVLGIDGSINFNNISYSFNKEQNQKIINYSASTSAKWQFASKTYLESDFDYSVYKNEKFGFNQNIPMLNASIRQILGKTNRLEMRLAAFDIFDRNRSISQSGALNYVIRTTASTLSRYFMLSISYNIKGFETKLKKENGMF